MINISPVETLDHELPRETEVFTDAQGLLIYVFGGEVLCYTTIIGVRELCRVDLVVEQVVNIDIVDVSLNGFQVNVL